MSSSSDSESTSPQIRKKSRIEINVSRLLTRCEEMTMDADNIVNPDNWRLGKYVDALDTMLRELKDVANPPSKDELQEYEGRVDFIKNILATAKLPSLPEKVIASNFIQPAQVTSPGMTSPMEIKHRHNTKYTEDLRKELLGDTPFQAGETGNEPLGSSLNDLVKYHHSIQEKIADHMLDLTRTLKEQVTIAGQVVKKDTEILAKSGMLIEKNEGNLKVETQKLEVFNRRGCKCWIWLMIVFVSSTFIAMVLFMRLFKKKNY